LIKGGSVEDGIMAITGDSVTDIIDKIKEYMRKVANWGPNSPGLPLSYVLNFVRNDSVTYIGMTNEYQKPVCYETRGTYNVMVEKIQCTRGDERRDMQLYERVLVKAWNDNREILNEPVWRKLRINGKSILRHIR
jgi:hypothetical protein